MARLKTYSYTEQHKQLQEGHCTCNVTVGRVRATIAAEEKQQVLHILSVNL
jgi:hypothetical protein